ncbi:MAG TPA: hypothetical protein VFS43_22880 [Polyangiaceae bacterium]|nr:hypothetical protein [Polyangiaceae bacterium]
MAKGPKARELAGLRELVERIRRVNPTGRGRSAREERARYDEKARLQSALIEAYPDEVCVRAHDDMPGVVSLAVPRLEASAAHAVLAALSARARAWVEGRLDAEAEGPASRRGRGPAPPAAPAPGGAAALARAARWLDEYDYECAETALVALVGEGDAPPAERRRALVLLLELYVDRLANDRAALALEPALAALDPAPEAAHELLGVAAERAGERDVALRHLGRCGGERAAEALAALAASAADANAWDQARRAWALLLAAAPPGGGAPPSPRLHALREGLRGRLTARAAEASERALEADAALVRFVKDFAPGHPWLDERKQSERALRASASARALLERAEAAASEGDFAAAERALAALARLEAPPGDGEAARLEALQAWARRRRDEAPVERAAAAAAAGALEDAGRIFLDLPERLRPRALASDPRGYFAALEALAAAAPGRPAAHALAAAAAAWVKAQESAEPAESWPALSPHVALLECVPAFAASLRALRPAAPPPPSHPAPPPPPSGPREVRSAGLRLIVDVDVDADADAGGAELLGVAGRALRQGALTFVVTLERPPGRDGVYDLALRPTAPHAPVRRVRLEGPPGWRPRGPHVIGRQIAVNEGPVVWLVDPSPDLGATRLELGSPGASPAAGGFAVVDEGTFALEAPRDDAPARWTLWGAATGEARGELRGPRLCPAPGAGGTTFFRVSGPSVERLDAAGGALERLELPRGVSPSAVLESPLGPAPLVLAASAGGPDVSLWWRTPEQLVRSFSLYSPAEHGALVEAVAFAGRAACLVTRRPDGEALLHTVWAERGTLRPRRCATGATGHQRLVVAPSGQRGWSVRRDAQGGVHLDPINLRPDDA